MRAPTIAFTGFILAAGIVLTGSARGQNSPDVKPIGKVMSLSGSVTIEHQGAVIVQANLPANGTGQAKIDDLVYTGDVLQTGEDGALGVSFSDGTSFNLTSKARMILNEFVYDPNGKDNSTLFSLIKGTFTFVAGKVAKTGRMNIDTPAAHVGIRGTTPHIVISDDGTVSYATLMEEGKNRALRAGDRRAVTVTPRQAQSGPSPQAPAGRQNKKDFGGTPSICRNC
jgi:hypothetical protein